ncbi:uncharacterized protein THITE_2120082 [Thermothielavioides terrestris NRRL 8126]|uniref:Uncharacterized protein n=1 Tax=Thermothielavioides terrestris (strain ATCC 38088 / NRRL 8126) TaxID=578455 RepID=G2R9J4_THETT|nr:uncharacterized protein THITE_2120082 [Thermothielavioides terrestris NRRL 8126]AEO69538.1 hypothetical protein THITE_2120082 [Thermothielavioides terrestris NRRL 8126]
MAPVPEVAGVALAVPKTPRSLSRHAVFHRFPTSFSRTPAASPEAYRLIQVWVHKERRPTLAKLSP